MFVLCKFRPYLKFLMKLISISVSFKCFSFFFFCVCFIYPQTLWTNLINFNTKIKYLVKRKKVFVFVFFSIFNPKYKYCIRRRFSNCYFRAMHGLPGILITVIVVCKCYFGLWGASTGKTFASALGYGGSSFIKFPKLLFWKNDEHQKKKKKTKKQGDKP